MPDKIGKYEYEELERDYNTLWEERDELLRENGKLKAEVAYLLNEIQLWKEGRRIPYGEWP